MGTSMRYGGWIVGSMTLALVLPIAAAGQASNIFGVQTRADAAQRMIVLAVEQGIASLPPTSGQSFGYEYDPKEDVYKKTRQLGPTAFRSTQTIAPGRLNLRVATSYFDAGHSLGPIDYRVSGPEYPNPPGFCTRFGLDASSEVALIDLSATYGVSAGADVTLNLPLVYSDTQASEVFITGNPMSAKIDPVACGQLDGLLRRGLLSTATRRFSTIRVDGGRVHFNDGTHFGLGRISIGGKVKLYSTPDLQLAFAPDVFLPSPNEEEFAGSDSLALSPRFLAQLKLHDLLRVHVDVGYSYDFSENELRRLSWNTGISTPLSVWSWPTTFDLGLGGSRFDEGITWTPSRTDLVDANGDVISFQTSSDNTLGNTFVDFLGGVKIALTADFVLSGAVDVPLNDQGFRPDVVGTIAAELYM